VQVEGEPARPAHVANAVAYLATAWKMPMEETCGIVAKNFMDLVDGNF
jgi:Tat protein secretion system quality control protein TatD with DNase activity